MTRVEHPRAEWLAKRRYDESRGGWIMTASDVAGAIGWDVRSFNSPLQVFVRKKTGKESDETKVMRNGLLLEPGIAEIFADETGQEITPALKHRLVYHPDVPWLACTPDFYTWPIDADPATDKNHPLEIKLIEDFRKMVEFKDGDCPLWLQIQLQIQIACLDAQIGEWAAKLPIGFEHGLLERNDAFIDSTIPRLDEFRRRLENDDPPPPESPKDLNAIKKLYPLDSGDTVQLDDAMLERVNQWEAVKQGVKSVNAEKDRLEAKIRAVIGEATFGLLNDGTMVTLKTIENKGHTTTVAPYSYRTLRRVKI